MKKAPAKVPIPGLSPANQPPINARPPTTHMATPGEVFINPATAVARTSYGATPKFISSIKDIPNATSAHPRNNMKILPIMVLVNKVFLILVKKFPIVVPPLGSLPR